MGRTNWIVLVIGVIGCAALAFAMQRVSSLQVERKQPRAQVEVRSVFGSRLEGPPRLTFGELADGWRAELRLRPLPGIRVDRLAVEAGQTVWRVGEPGLSLAEVIVECSVDGATPRRFRVPPPWRPTEPLRELDADPVAPPARPR